MTTELIDFPEKLEDTAAVEHAFRTLYTASKDELESHITRLTMRIQQYKNEQREIQGKINRCAIAIQKCIERLQANFDYDMWADTFK